jgi:heterodisulfide reductase subunit B
VKDQACYHEGCLARSIGAPMDRAGRAVADHLGLELLPVDWTCCGGPSASIAGPDVGRLTALINLARAAEAGPGAIATGCMACLRHLEEAAKPPPETFKPDPDPGVRAAEEKATGVRTMALHELLLDGLLAREPRPPVIRPLTGLCAAAYYGCRAFRTGRGEPRVQSGRSLEDALLYLGAEVAAWGAAGECNGGYLTLSRSDIVEERTSLILDEAVQSGANAVVVVCALCHFNLTRRPLECALPLFYFPQALGIALGLEPGALGMSLVHPGRRLLGRLGIL